MHDPGRCGVPVLFALVLREVDAMDPRFERLYIEARETFVRVAYGITKTMEDAEEAVQEAILSLMRVDGTKLEDARVPAYAFVSVKNAALQLLRRKNRQPEISLPEIDALAADLTGPEPADDSTHWDECLREAMEHLPTAEATIIKMLLAYPKPKELIDALVRATGQSPTDSLRRKVKVQLAIARKRLEMLAKLCDIRRNSQSPTLHSLVETTYTGDCVYHDMQWGLRHYRKLEGVPKTTLFDLVVFTRNIHLALRAPKNIKFESDRCAIFGILTTESPSTRRIRLKNEKEKVRITLTVLKLLQKDGDRVRLEALREEFKGSHLALRRWHEEKATQS